MNSKLLIYNKRKTKCGLSECCPIQDDALAEAREWELRAKKYEQILKMHNLLKEEPNKLGVFRRILSINNIDLFFIYACYIVGFASILFGWSLSNNYFITLGVLSLLLVTIHTGGSKDE
ncbi:hypothetical protein ANME2D_00229 [Candidatus Methanoperedens nitroreducens]|uniref:Uncharacterized protein n=1 Tax=Candidatus Methanoperedens nitratireducens TaxID=1392998 RepID=A0A062VBT4_9EURY|nr:hypothetical protein [Candidatus Methanoperedens nitroreducens]KCZ73169.1 hypothetical protein ANME2D_00229 [Candidatus Methanoperedens nitroreducens]MDJ1422882.1 hypothetical protein [Candidatus Methanoperedens sp.]